MPKLPKGKVRLEVLISEDVAKKFYELVKMKHENLRGALSYEVEQALRNWIAAHTSSTQILAKKSNPQPKALVVWERVKEYLKRRLDIPTIVAGMQVHKSFLIEAIAAVRGEDPRTIRKWLDKFIEYKLVKPLGPNVYEVI